MIFRITTDKPYPRLGLIAICLNGDFRSGLLVRVGVGILRFCYSCCLETTVLEHCRTAGILTSAEDAGKQTYVMLYAS